MKINVSTKNNIVSSAFFEIKELSLSLYINTKDRWRNFDFVETEEGMIKFGYFADQNNNEIEHDSVSLHAENCEEIEMLKRFYFLLASKEQLWVLMPVESVYK